MPRDRRRFPLEAGPKLDVNALRLRPNTHLFARMSYRSGLSVAVAACPGEHDGWLDLTFEGQRQRIPLEARPRPFGGCQWYMRCPYTGRRVATLWRPPGASGFASRHAWRNAAYATQFQDSTSRAWTAKRKVARRLGSMDPNDYDLPEKPRWMRWGPSLGSPLVTTGPKRFWNMDARWRLAACFARASASERRSSRVGSATDFDSACHRR